MYVVGFDSSSITVDTTGGILPPVQVRTLDRLQSSSYAFRELRHFALLSFIRLGEKVQTLVVVGCLNRRATSLLFQKT